MSRAHYAGCDAASLLQVLQQRLTENSKDDNIEIGCRLDISRQAALLEGGETLYPSPGWKVRGEM
jgi:hypothetical protein